MDKVDYPTAVMGAIGAFAIWVVYSKKASPGNSFNGARTYHRGTPPSVSAGSVGERAQPVLPGGTRPNAQPVVDIVPGEYPPECSIVDTPKPSQLKSYW